MKKLITYGVCLILAFAAASCNERETKDSKEIVDNGFYSKLKNPTQKDVVNTTGTARIKFDSEDYRFDTIVEGEQIYTSYKFQNVGDAPLIIKSTKTVCGCTAAKYSEEPIAPGEFSSIDVHFDSRGRRGMQSKAISVISNGEPYKSGLVIKGFVSKK